MEGDKYDEWAELEKVHDSIPSSLQRGYISLVVLLK
jgi:hypothetical protein